MPRLLSHRAALAPLLTLAALALPAGVLVPGGPYRDDRSSPEAVILSLYDAVNRQDWPRAWSYYAEGSRPDYRRFAAGYGDTEEVSVKTGMPTWEGAVGSTWWLVPTVIEARGSDGTVTVYVGCYVLQQSNPHLRDTPPYDPIAIVRGRLRPVDQPFGMATGDCSGM